MSKSYLIEIIKCFVDIFWGRFNKKLEKYLKIVKYAEQYSYHKAYEKYGKIDKTSEHGKNKMLNFIAMT